MDQDQLITRITDILREDQRVLGAWLSGSRGRGTEDQFSDVDVWLVVTTADKDAFVKEWPATSDRIGPTVLRQAVFGTTFTHITPEWFRYDVSIGVPDDASTRSRTTHKTLFDRANITAQFKPVGDLLQPDPQKVSSLVVEFLRVMGLLPVVLGRQDFVVGVSGASLLRGLLVQLSIEDVVAEDRGGALSLERTLQDEQLRGLADLPALAATRESVLAVHLACADLFLPTARNLMARLGAPWPAPLEDALRKHLRATIQVDLP
ncbi:nucleotidyltransferase domain-containing protein [Phytoactinopolyspora limicola]|uniref:nucleotidyltransferase domain-containing protein n=1 Tax=Phytoactinopolyspora limicola TaxID=2715536 RepID=UPI00140CEB6E|nr:nucleotidyltransferase domain-containing protein [Phytoactinopolyspora limicola]